MAENAASVGLLWDWVGEADSIQVWNRPNYIKTMVTGLLNEREKDTILSQSRGTILDKAQ